MTLVSSAILSIVAASTAQAGSFSLYTESSPAAIGNYAAGAAAEAADASTGWYNPAGLVLLSGEQAVFGGVGVFPSTRLTGSSTYTVDGLPSPFDTYTESFANIQGAESALVPAFHYALPLGENATFGLSVVAPFGLSTDWGSESPVRYEATLSDLFTANISPQLGARITEHFALGAGLDLQYARVKFNRMIGVPNITNVLDAAGACDAAGLNCYPSMEDTLSYNKGDSFGVGYHVGGMGIFNDKHTRLGINYQSKIRHTFDGYSELSGPLASTGNLFVDPALPYAVVRNNNLNSNAIEFPDVLTLSAYQDVNDRFALLASVVFTGWSCFETIQLNNVAAPNVESDGDVSQVSVNAATPQNYRDAWRAALGANYRFNDQWMLRVGGGYDQTPTTNAYRDVRLPDTDRWALSIGGHYQARENIGVDVGYTHLFADNNSGVNTNDALTPTSSFGVNATSYASADLVGAQVVWLMDKPFVASATK